MGLEAGEFTVDPALAEGSERSLLRGVRIMRELAGGSGLSAEAIADQVDLPLSTVYRFLATLRSVGLAEQIRGLYYIGPEISYMARSRYLESAIVRESRQILHAAAEVTGGTADVMCRVGDRAICLLQVQPNRAEKYPFRQGEAVPLHAGAGQRLLLAYAPETVMRLVLSRPLTRFTDATYDAAELAVSLPRIRREHYAVSFGELLPGVVCVAVPVLSAGEVVCAITLASTEQSIALAWRRKAFEILRAAASELAKRLA